MARLKSHYRAENNKDSVNIRFERRWDGKLVIGRVLNVSSKREGK